MKSEEKMRFILFLWKLKPIQLNTLNLKYLSKERMLELNTGIEFLILITPNKSFYL